MRRCLGFCLLVVLLLSARPLFAQGFNIPERAKAFATAPDIPYDSVANFLKMPANIYLGESVGVARNSKNEVFVFNRNGESSRLFKFDSNGKVIMLMGRRPESHGLLPSPARGTPPPMAPYPPYAFSRPTDITWDPQGNIFVSDGYGFSRVA